MRRALSTACVLFGAPIVLGAQVVRATPDSAVARGTMTIAGTVKDLAGAPLLGAEASVSERQRALTDAAGSFALRGVPAGKVHLWVRRIGYQPVSFDVEAAAGTRVEVAVRLTPTPVRLSEVIVEGKAYDRALWDAGFYRRERATRGRFLDADFLAHFGGAGVSTLLRETPRVMVERRGNENFAYSSLAGGRCRMNVYVDGKLAREALPGSDAGGVVHPGVGIDAVVPRDMIHAMEIYPTVASVPTEFQRIGPANNQRSRSTPQIPSPRGVAMSRPPSEPSEGGQDAACGAIVIWTKLYVAKQQAADTARHRPT